MLGEYQASQPPAATYNPVMRALLASLLVLTLAAAEPAAEIDALIEADLAARSLQPLPPADTTTLVRRTWLDLGGRIPTYAESTGSPDGLTGRLIGSPAWRQATFTWLADVLRVQSRLQDRTPGVMWIAWLDQAVADNRPWDVMTRDLLTASGPAFAADGGATGFALRDAGMPLDHAALTAQTFLGTRIGCAQCHDHPFDDWKRLDFLRFAAFAADARTDLKAVNLRGLKERLAEAQPALRNATRLVANFAGSQVQPARKDWLEVPKDWQYDDAKPGEHVAAQALFQPAAPAAAGDPRQRLAAWMTAPENPRFALAIGNRVWKRLFGLGLIEPVDDLRGDPDGPLPPLQARLARLVVDSGFDLQRIHLVLASTRHYARATWTGERPARGGVVPGRPAERLPATAWWDSLVALTLDDPDLRAPLDTGRIASLRDKIADGGIDSVLDTARRVLALRQGGAKAAKADPDMATVVMALRPPSRRSGHDTMLRASQLPQPAPAGHPLRVLGASDRELIDNASTTPDTSQALLMMNGVIDSEVLAPRSRLMRELTTISDPEARLAHLWQAVLVRPPSPHELDRARPELARGPTGLADVAWALLNGAEFRMVR